MEPTRTFDILENYRHEYAYKQDAIAAKEQGFWVKYSSGDYVANSNYVSYGLMALGLKKGERIVTISNNRPEWNFMDMGMSQAGIIHVPIYPTLSEDDYDYILNHAEPTFIFMSDKTLCDRIGPIARKVSSIKEIYSFNEIKGIRNWKEILELGKQKDRLP